MQNTLHFLSQMAWLNILSALSLGILGYIFAKRLSFLIEKLIKKKFSRHQAMLASRLIFYGIFLLFIISSLQQLGFKLTVLLGAAGVFTVAISFASQTAVSNLISGIFLLFERPFKVGDQITIDGITGSVEAIDWLSTKIKTNNNQLVRLPNETLIKSKISNLSYFPNQRHEVIIKIDFSQDVNAIKNILYRATLECHEILNKPSPQTVISNFIEGGIELTLYYWTKQDSMLIRDDLLSQINLMFSQEHVSLLNTNIIQYKASFQG